MYITTDLLIENGISGETSYLNFLIERVESVFNSLIGIETGILSQTREDIIYSPVSCYILKYSKATSIEKVNGVSLLSTDYFLDKNKITFKEIQNPISNFPYTLKIEYTAGYTEAPQDVVQICLSLASYFHNTKNASGISGFKQDLLSVDYGAKEVHDYLDKLGQNIIINKYKHYYAYPL